MGRGGSDMVRQLSTFVLSSALLLAVPQLEGAALPAPSLLVSQHLTVMSDRCTTLASICTARNLRPAHPHRELTGIGRTGSGHGRNHN